MNKRLHLACAIVAGLALSGCATRAPLTTAMGAGPACDLSVDVRGEHRCAVSHVTPVDPLSQMINDMHQWESVTVTRVR